VPKTSSGKLQRHACRAGYLAGHLELVGERRAAAARVLALADGPSDAAARAGAAGGPRAAAAIEAWLITRLAAQLQVDPAEIDPRRPFARHGLDSLKALLLAGELEAWLGRALPPTLVWDYPTIEALARHLSGEVPHAA
jgi:acyl carrier protein